MLRRLCRTLLFAFIVLVPAIGHAVTRADLEVYHFHDLCDDGGNVYALVSQKVSEANYTDPDGTISYQSDLYLLKILAGTGAVSRVKLDTLYMATNSTATGAISIQNAQIIAFMSHKTSATYAMDGNKYILNKGDLSLSSQTQLFTYANWGWYPVINSSQQISHFSFAGYYRMLDDTYLGSVTPATMQSEYDSERMQHSSFILPDTDPNVVTALLDQFGTGSSAYVPIAEKLYVSYFGRPADPAGLANMEAQFAAAGAPTTAQAFVDAYATNATVKAVIDSFGNSQESKNLYGTGSTQTFVTAIFTYLLNRSPLDAGLTYWSNAIDSGAMSRGQAAMNILVGAENNTSTQGLIDAARLANVVTISANFTHSIDTPEEVAGYAGQVAAGKARTMLATVTNTTDPVVFQDTVDTTIAGMGVATTCGSFTLGSTSTSASSDGGTGSLSVTGTSGCAWTATSNASWITVTSGTSGSGSGSVGYSVAANTGSSSRTGSMTIGGVTFTVSQAAPAATCGAATISPASSSVSSAGGTGSVSVTASSGCPWTASSNASWITVTSGASGSGSGSVGYSVAANTGTSARTGTVTIGGQAFTVSQAALAATSPPTPGV